MKTAVIGIGNLLFEDEGVGVHVANALGMRYSLSGDCVIIDGGTKGLELLPIIEEQDALVLVDAVDFGKEPGYIKVIEDSDMKAYLDLKFSVHQIGIPDMLFAMEFKGIKPPKLCLVGIQPESLELKPSLTHKLAGKLDELVEIVVGRLKDWGIPVEERDEIMEPSPEYRHVSGDPL
jgi:hydrogenase maturation protease